MIHKERSKSITGYTGNTGAIDREKIQAERSEQREQSYNKSIEEVSRITHALEHVKDDKGYKVLEAYYIKGQTIKEIAKKLRISEKTATKWKRELVQKIAIILFGSKAIQ